MAKPTGSKDITFGMDGLTSESDATSGSTSTTVVANLDHTSNSIQITVHRLNGRNFLEWSQSVKLAIDGRGKLGYLTRETKQRAKNDP